MEIDYWSINFHLEMMSLLNFRKECLSSYKATAQQSRLIQLSCFIKTID